MSEEVFWAVQFAYGGKWRWYVGTFRTRYEAIADYENFSGEPWRSMRRAGLVRARKVRLVDVTEDRP